MKNKGITLIALVITIIVLLIIAGVSIATLIGENGILNQATEAKGENNKATVLEKVKIEVMGSYGQDGTIDIAKLNENLGNIKNIEGLLISDLPATVKVDGYEIQIKKNGEVTILSEESSGNIQPGEIVTDGNKQYKKNGIAIIPEGFAIVPGLDNVAEGLVISDLANDVQNKGNQFVWIPVENSSDRIFNKTFKRTEGYFNKTIQTGISTWGEAGIDGINERINETETTKREAIAMYNSVKKNGGFYIGRYETGKDIDGNVVCQKNVNAYNNIPWSSSEDTMIDIGGAVEEARKFSTKKGYHSLTSTLCYGVQWDATLNFIDSNYITNEKDGKANCAIDSYLVDSSGKGWYMDNYSTGNPDHKTGIDVDNKASNRVKNIYDMAGNLYEWTMESFNSENTVSRIYRGGYGNSDGSIYSVSIRDSHPSIFSDAYIGFRITLYIN